MLCSKVQRTFKAISCSVVSLSPNPQEKQKKLSMETSGHSYTSGSMGLKTKSWHHWKQWLREQYNQIPWPWTMLSKGTCVWATSNTATFSCPQPRHTGAWSSTELWIWGGKTSARFDVHSKSHRQRQRAPRVCLPHPHFITRICKETGFFLLKTISLELKWKLL